jgi:hypothetical protein
MKQLGLVDEKLSLSGLSLMDRPEISKRLKLLN